ncbi:hypothetical protein KCU71_g712, partial [Aureobasidium melanogenum]
MKHQSLADHILADPLLFAKAVLNDKQTAPNAISFVSLLETIQKLGYSEDDLEKAADIILGSSIAPVELPSSFPDQPPIIPTPSKAIACKPPPGLYRITCLGDVLDSPSTPLGDFLLTVGHGGWNTRLVRCHDEWCEAALQFDSKNIQWRLHWITSAGYQYDLAFSEEQSPVTDLSVTQTMFRGTVINPKIESEHDEIAMVSETVKLQGVLESPETILATLLGSHATSLTSDYPNKPMTNSKDSKTNSTASGGVNMSNSTNTSNNPNGGGQSSGFNNGGGKPPADFNVTKGSDQNAGALVVLGILAFLLICLILCIWRRARQARRARRQVRQTTAVIRGNNPVHPINPVNLGNNNVGAIPPSPRQNPSTRPTILDLEDGGIDNGLTNADVIQHIFAEDESDHQEAAAVEIVVTENNQRATFAFPRTATFNVDQPYQINPNTTNFHIIDNEYDVVASSARDLGQRRRRTIRRYLIVRTACNQAALTFRRDPDGDDGSAGGHPAPQENPNVSSANPGSQVEGGQGTGSNNNNTNAVEVPLGNDLLHASEWSQVCLFLDVQDAAANFFAEKLARGAQDTIKGSLFKTGPFGEATIPLQSSAIEWDSMLTSVLLKLEAELSASEQTLWSIENIQETFLRRVQGSLMSKIQGSLTLQYTKLAKEQAGSTLIQIFGTSRFASNTVLKAVETATRSETVIEGIARESRRILAVKALSSPSVAYGSTPKPAEIFKLQQSVEEAAERCQRQFLSYVNKLTELLESGETNSEQAVQAVAASAGLAQTGSGSFAPVKMPKAEHGVPLWLLDMGGKGMEKEASTGAGNVKQPVQPVAPAGKAPVPVAGGGSGHFAKLSGGVVIGGSGVNPHVPSQNPSVVKPSSRASSIVSDSPKVEIFLLGPSQKVQVISSLAQGVKKNR